MRRVLKGKYPYLTKYLDIGPPGAFSQHWSRSTAAAAAAAAATHEPAAAATQVILLLLLLLLLSSRTYCLQWSTHPTRKKFCTTLSIGGCAATLRLCGLAAMVLSTCKNQRTRETDKCRQVDYLEHIDQDSAFDDCSLGTGPNQQFVDPRRRWAWGAWGSRQISRKTKTPVPTRPICGRRSSLCGQIAPVEKIVTWTFDSATASRAARIERQCLERPGASLEELFCRRLVH